MNIRNVETLRFGGSEDFELVKISTEDVISMTDDHNTLFITSDSAVATLGLEGIADSDTGFEFKELVDIDFNDNGSTSKVSVLEATGSGGETVTLFWDGDLSGVSQFDV